jgi:hypothetical protein
LNMNRVRNIIREAKRSGLDLTMPESQGSCALSIGEYKETPIILYFFPGEHSELVLKLERELHDCTEALYCPKGLFQVVDSSARLEDIIKKLTKKLEHLVMIE